MSTTNNNPSWTRATIEPHRGLPFRVKDALHKSIGSFPRWWAVADLSWECIELWRQPFQKKTRLAYRRALLFQYTFPDKNIISQKWGLCFVNADTNLILTN